MSCCSIRWCGKNSKNSNFKAEGITFHRFPRKPDIKEKWIECTKRENWFPSNYSVVCSRHFTEDCFYTMKSRRRLFYTAIPTLNLPIVANITAPSERTLEFASPLDLSSSQYKLISSTLRVTKRKTTNPESPSQFHSPIKNRLSRRISELANKVNHKNKTIKPKSSIMFDQSKRSKLTVTGTNEYPLYGVFDARQRAAPIDKMFEINEP
ncbi:uncharacterized protein ACR2FA_011390 [Aphomia sociella]